MAVEIPNYGRFQGLERDGVCQFKNIPFAFLSKRFTEAELHDFVGDVDCTEQGPLCPQDAPYSDSYLGVPEQNVKKFEFKIDEFKCLNLMITSPAKCAGPVPVVIWIHGGSNCMGTAYRGVNNPFNWVKRGIDTNTPLIVVTLQFRVSVFGFLPFNGVGNWGLMDQKLGIEWVHKYIKYFGGDPSRISLFGQSSGSQNAYLQTRSQTVPRFRQAAYLSGSLDALRFKTLEDYAKLSSRMCQTLNCTEKDLQTLPWQDLVAAFRETGVAVLSAVDDRHFLSPNTTSAQLERVLLSDCSQDGWFFKDEGPPLVDLIRPKMVNDASYELKTDEDACRLLTDYIFFAGNYKQRRAFEAAGTTVFTECFDAINPLTPALGNNHMVELFFTLQAYELDAEHTQLAQSVQDVWTKFVHFEDPWPASGFAHVTDKVRIRPLEELSKVRNMRALELELKELSAISGW